MLAEALKRGQIHFHHHRRVTGRPMLITAPATFSEALIRLAQVEYNPVRHGVHAKYYIRNKNLHNKKAELALDLEATKNNALPKGYRQGTSGKAWKVQTFKL